jgi:hypothetical protein
MTGDEGLFAPLNHYDNPTETIIYGDNGQGDVVGLGKIAISTTKSIEDVYHVQGLGYNLLSVSQLCETGYNCLFTHEGVIVSRREDSSIVFAGHLRGKLYYVDFTKVKVDPKACLVAKSDLGWLWHCRLAHVGMRNLAKVQKDEHILGLTNVVFEKDMLCSACQAGKQVGAHHPAKNILSSSRPLKLLHIRDCSFARGHGYPRIPDPTGKGMGKKFHPRVRVRVENFTREHQTGIKLHPRVLPVTRLNIKGHQNIR